MRFLVLLLLVSSPLQYSFAQESDEPEVDLAELIAEIEARSIEAALKADDPDELAYYASIETECPFSNTELKNMVEGVFVRSRVRPTDNWVTADVYLNVLMNCLVVETGNGPIGYTYYLDLRFAPSEKNVLYDRQFGVLGLTPTDGDILDNIKNQVEAAVTAYIKANL